jgi:hypothetical protein
MKTRVREGADAAGWRDSARCTVHLIGTLALYAALLLVGARLTGLAWEDLSLFLLPPLAASAGPGLAFLILDRMDRRSAVPAVADCAVGT